MDKGDFPHDYFSTFGAIASTYISLLLPGFIVTPIMGVLANAILPSEEQTWLMQNYLPEIVKATENNSTPLTERLNLIIIFSGVLLKLIFAFVFQEKFLPIPGFETHPAILIGGSLIPYLNGIADSLTGFQQTDANVNESQFVYPGQAKCKHDQGHSIWHEVSANGLLDLMFFCDHMSQLIDKYVL